MLRINRGKLPEEFLRGCGLLDWEISLSRLYDPGLSRREVSGLLRDIVDSRIGKNFCSAFISYSRRDQDFARRLHRDLQAKGVRCWLDEKEILPGDDIDRAIAHGINAWDYVILCCSRNALTSWWVDDELNHVFAKEKRLSKGSDHTRCVIPLTLDNYVFEEWNHHYKNRVTRLNVADFRDWTNDDSYEEQFDRIVKKLRADAGGREPDPQPKFGQ